MSGRGLDAAFLTELFKKDNQPCYLVEAVFDDGAVRMTDAWRSITWSGNTFNANGHFLGFSGLTETLDLSIPSVTVTISAVDQTWLAIVLSKQYMDRPARIYKAFIDYTAGVISTPALILDGRLDGLAIIDDPENSKLVVQATVGNQWSDFTRAAGRHTNDVENQIYFPGDKFFDRNTDFNRQLRWGPP